MLSPRLSLRYADLTQYSAAILDFQMPEMNGGELAAELKKRNPQMPVVILSALSALPDGTPDAYDAFMCKGESGFALVNKVQELISDSAEETVAERKPLPMSASSSSNGWDRGRNRRRKDGVAARAPWQLVPPDQEPGLLDQPSSVIFIPRVRAGFILFG